MVESWISRRCMLGGTMASLAVAPAWALASWDQFAVLEKSSGARIGVAAIDTGDGRTLCWRESERFLMCSSFKLSLAAAVLARADAGQEKLDRVIRYQKADLLDVSPATSANLATGMRVDALCQAAVIASDNTAANLLLASLGGPAGVTAFWRSLGDATSRLDRIEPMLNLPDGEKDTTTPVAMLGNLKTILLGDALRPESRRKLADWMAASTTGNLMLRAGLPQSWTIGDKTGRYAGDAHNAAIDLAIATPPGRKPVLIAAFTRDGLGDDAAHQAVLADIGNIATTRFA